MNTIEPPKAHYSVTLDAQIEGLTLPLQVHAESVNELRKAVRLLRANDMLARQPPSTGNHERVSTCRSCAAPVVWRERNGKRHPYDVVDGTPTDVSHFRTCPDRDTWSKKGATP